MTTAEWIALAILILLGTMIVIGVVRLEKRRTAWNWLHPPNEDEDGVCILKDDDPDGENTR